MGMSTHVVGFKPPNDKWKQMRHAYDSCKIAGIDIPEEVNKYFNYEEPDSAGVEVDLKSTEWNIGHASGIEIDISKLDKDVKIIRFYNSW